MTGLLIRNQIINRLSPLYKLWTNDKFQCNYIIATNLEYRDFPDTRNKTGLV